MDAELKKKWIENLRSGNFLQGTCSLYNEKDDSYCCLGVGLISMGVPKEKILTPKYFSNIDDARQKGLPIDYPTEQKLIELNDHELKSFSEIANYIEKNL